MSTELQQNTDAFRTIQSRLFAKYCNGKELGELHRALNEVLSQFQNPQLPNRDEVFALVSGNSAPRPEWVIPLYVAWGIKDKGDQEMLRDLVGPVKKVTPAPDPAEPALPKPLAPITPTPAIQHPRSQGKIAPTYIDFGSHLGGDDAKTMQSKMNRAGGYITLERAQKIHSGEIPPNMENIRALAKAYDFSDDLIRALKDQEINSLLRK